MGRFTETAGEPGESFAPGSDPAFVRDGVTWLAYGLLGYFAFFQAVPGAIAPYLRAELGIDYTLAGLHVSAFAIGAALAAGLASWLDARVGRRVGLWIGAIGMITGATLMTLPGTVLVTLGGAFVMGGVGTVVLVLVQATLADRHPAHRAVALSEANAMASAGALGVPVVVVAGDAVGMGWRAAVAAGALALAGLAVAGRRVPVSRPAAMGTGDGPGGPLPWRVWAAVTLLFLAVAAEWCVAFWGATYLDDAVGLPTAAAVGSMSGFFGAMLVGRLVGSRLARRSAPRPLVAAALAVAVVGFALLWWAPTPAFAVAGLVVAGLGFGNLFPLSLSVGMELAPEATTRVSGRAVSAGALGVLLLPVTLGRVADAVGLATAMGVVLLLLAAATVALRLTTVTKRPAEEVSG